MHQNILFTIGHDRTRSYYHRILDTSSEESVPPVKFNHKLQIFITNCLLHIFR